MNQPAAPTVTEMLTVPLIRDELDAAWYDSLPGDPARRHEQGGWVYFSSVQLDYQIRRSAAGGQAFLDLDDPPEIAGYFVVATYHTHPNPASEGWHTGPSREDTES